jgi:diguanylate cyclase (GGDEF)-like protein/PAS domain S-box-containing protein
VVIAMLVLLLVLAGAMLLATAYDGRRARATKRQLAVYRVLAENMPPAVLVFDRRLRHVLASGRALSGLGLTPLSARGRTPRELFSDSVGQILEPAYRAALEGCESHIDLPYRDRDWVVTIAPAGEDAGVLVAADVTDRKRRERRLTELASRDPLTGSWNRRRLTEELEWLAQGGGTGALLLLDLDGFKGVNDVLGHDAGDELLRRAAVAVQGCVRRADVVARLGGDEFAVLLAGAAIDEAQSVAEKIRNAVVAIWPLGVPGGVSIGIADVGTGAAEALARADRAMYAVKQDAPLRRAS